MNLQKPLQMTDEIANCLYLFPDIPNKYHRIDFEELLEMCLDRVKSFKKIDLMMMQNTLDGAKYALFLQDQAMKCYQDGNCMTPRSTDVEKVQDFWDRDKVTHQLLEAIYSSDEDQIRQFCRFERILLETRLKQLHINDSTRIRIFEYLGCNVKQMTQEKWEDLLLKKKVVVQYSKYDKWSDYCEIPFTNVTAAVATHSCFLYKGVAYLKYEQLDKCLLDIFHDKMFDRLMKLNKNVEYQQWLEQDEQMQQAIQIILNADFGQDLPAIGNNAKITHLNIKQFANTSFPPCMKYLFDKLQENHHLKHDGRQQLQLFLKSAEMPINEALIFWKFTFGTKFSDSEFDKKYSYNIRHNYGLEGKRSDYKCNSCAYNFKKTPGNQEYHGCPIKVFNEDNFKKYLLYNDIKNVDEILELKSKNHFQVACNKIWAAKHPDMTDDFVITNPIEYFVHSVSEKKK